MQSRFIKTYGILFMLALFASLALTACGGSDNNRANPSPSPSPTKGVANINLSVDLPTNAKALADTKQILVYLTQKNAQKQDEEVTGSREIFVSRGTEPYISGIKSGYYENHPAEGKDHRYVTFTYQTNKVDDGERYTVVLEYLGESNDDVIAKAFHEQLTGFESGESIELSADSESEEFKVKSTDDAKLEVNPTSIDAEVGGDTVDITCKVVWTVAHTEDVTMTSEYTVSPSALGKVEKAGGKATFTAEKEGTGTVTVTDKYGNVKNIDVTVTEPTPPTPTTYTLIVDYSGVNDPYLHKDDVQKVFIGENEATKGEKYTASLSDQTSGSYKVKFEYKDGTSVETNRDIPFTQETESGVIKYTLKDGDFNRQEYDLVVNYGKVNFPGTVKSVMFGEVPATSMSGDSARLNGVPAGSRELTFEMTDGKKYKTTKDFPASSATAEGVISVTVTDKDFTLTYKLVVDYSQVTGAAIPVAVTGVKIGSYAATLGESETAYVTDKPAGSYKITFTTDKDDYYTKKDIDFVAKKGESEIKVILTDDDFDCKYSLKVDYSGVEIAFNKDEVSSILSHEVGDFTVPTTGYVATSKYRVKIQGSSINTKLQFTAEGVTYTTEKDIPFKTSEAKDGVISVSLTDKDFPELYTLVVNYSQISSSELDKEAVTGVKFDNTDASFDKTAYTATLKGVDKPSEGTIIKRTIKFIGDSFEKQTSEQIDFDTTEAAPGRVITVVLPETTKLKGVDYTLTLNFEGAVSELYYGKAITTVKLSGGYKATPTGDVATFTAPLGTYDVSLEDGSGNTYTYPNSITFSRDPKTPGESTQTVKYGDFDADPLTLKLDFSNKDVKDLLVNEPDGAKVKHGEEEGKEFQEKSDEWYAYYEFETNPVTDWTDCTVKVVCNDNEVELNKPKSFNRSDAKNNTITVKVEKDDFTTYPMKVTYGNDMDVPIIDLSKVTSITIDGMATTISEPRGTMTITATTDPAVRGAGQYKVVINSSTLGEVPLDNIAFKVKDDVLAATLTDTNFPKELYVTEVKLTGLGAEEKVYNVVLMGKTEKDATLVNESTNTYYWQDCKFDDPTDPPACVDVKAYLSDKTVKDNVQGTVKPARHYVAEYDVSGGTPVESVINVTIGDSQGLIDPGKVTGVAVLIKDEELPCTCEKVEVEGEVTAITGYLSTPREDNAGLLVYFEDGKRHVSTSTTKELSHSATPLEWDVVDTDIAMNQGSVRINLSALKDTYTIEKIQIKQQRKQSDSKSISAMYDCVFSEGGLKQQIHTSMIINCKNGKDTVATCTHGDISIDDSTNQQVIVVSEKTGWTITPSL